MWTTAVRRPATRCPKSPAIQCSPPCKSASSHRTPTPCSPTRLPECGTAADNTRHSATSESPSRAPPPECGGRNNNAPERQSAATDTAKSSTCAGTTPSPRQTQYPPRSLSTRAPSNEHISPAHSIRTYVWCEFTAYQRGSPEIRRNQPKSATHGTRTGMKTLRIYDFPSIP